MASTSTPPRFSVLLAYPPWHYDDKAAAGEHAAAPPDSKTISKAVGSSEGTVTKVLTEAMQAGVVQRRHGEPKSGYGQRPWVWSMAVGESACHVG